MTNPRIKNIIKSTNAPSITASIIFIFYPNLRFVFVAHDANGGKNRLFFVTRFALCAVNFNISVRRVESAVSHLAADTAKHVAGARLF